MQGLESSQFCVFAPTQLGVLVAVVEARADIVVGSRNEPTKDFRLATFQRIAVIARTWIVGRCLLAVELLAHTQSVLTDTVDHAGIARIAGDSGERSMEAASLFDTATVRRTGIVIVTKRGIGNRMAPLNLVAGIDGTIDAVVAIDYGCHAAFDEIAVNFSVTVFVVVSRTFQNGHGIDFVFATAIHAGFDRARIVMSAHSAGFWQDIRHSPFSQIPSSSLTAIVPIL